MFSIQELHFPFYTLKDYKPYPALEIGLDMEEFTKLKNFVILNLFFNNESHLKETFGINYYTIMKFFQQHNDFVIVDDCDRSKFHSSLKVFYSHFTDTVLQLNSDMNLMYTTYLIRNQEDLKDSLKVYSTLFHFIKKYTFRNFGD